MKKLMITAGAVAIAAGAFAAAPVVYDYKASVKYLDLKEITLTDAAKNKVTVYQKIQKSATLKGYLVQDVRGATSPIITATYTYGATALPAGAYHTYNPAGSGPVALAQDQGRNRAFLIVYNSGATPAQTRRPKIMPAVLDARWMNTKCDNKTYITEGTLFVGGDLSAAYVRQRLDLVPASELANAVVTLTPSAKAGNAGFYGDYGWTSEYLFGQYNGPQWSTLWDNFQTALDGAQPVIKSGKAVGDGRPFYHDTWMNHAGIGKATVTTDAGFICCGMSVAAVSSVGLDSLTGNLKGGLFLCSENGYGYLPAYGAFNGGLWEDQFFTRAPIPHDNIAGATWYNATQLLVAPFTITPSTLDVDQADIWQDGEIEQNVTDVIYGTFSIKRNNAIAVGAATTGSIKGDLDNLWAAPAATGYQLGNGTGAKTTGDLVDLIATLKAASLKLDKTCTFMGSLDNWEVEATVERFNLPVVTPSFAAAYGLAHFTQY